MSYSTMVGIPLCSKTSFPPFLFSTPLPATHPHRKPALLNFISTGGHFDVNPIGFKILKSQGPQLRLLKSSSTSATPTSNNETAASVVTEPASPKPETTALDSGAEVVRKFYGGINARDVAFVEELIAEDCVYEDLVFPQPFVGRTAILQFFQKFIDSISKDLQFAIDDISDEDSSAVGVTWHLEWKGKPFPFSKGCSFYRLKIVNGQRRIIPRKTFSTERERRDRRASYMVEFCMRADLSYGRDIVEPATKPGDFGLVAIRGVTWLLQRFPKLADQF